jgi:hypothetical protein
LFLVILQFNKMVALSRSTYDAIMDGLNCRGGALNRASTVCGEVSFRSIGEAT